MTTAETRITTLVVGNRGLLGRELMAVFSSVAGVDLDECDITDPGQVSAVLDRIRPVRVINVAAYTDVDGCETDPDRARAANADGPFHLARACRDRRIPLVHLSTDFVFDGAKGAPYREDDRPRPLSEYGRTKLAGEEAVRHAGGDHLIVRTSWLFGSGGKNFPDTILAAARTREALTVVDDQIGSPTSAVDLAGAIEALCRVGALGTVHVANSGYCSWCEYARFVVETAGLSTRVLPISSSELDRAAPRPAFSVLCLDRYHQLTGSWMRPWREAVGEFVRLRRTEGAH